MRIHELKLESNRLRKRKGRGISAGQGKTAGRGTKGQKSRSGGSLRPGFEGGQNPLIQRIPKLLGFKSRSPKVNTLSLSDLELVSGKQVTNQTLAARGVIPNTQSLIKVVASGQIKSAKTVKLQAASKQAKAKIEQAGGSFETVKPPKPVSSQSDKQTAKSDNSEKPGQTGRSAKP